jgi:glutathione synthase/RimK-type ligase-like ATP-grasp enzyme
MITPATITAPAPAAPPAEEHSATRTWRTVPRTAATLALPFNLAVTSAALLRSAVVRPRREVAEHPRTILISGGKMTKALQLARSFHRAGHRVVLVESARYRLTGHRFSRAVATFRTVPKPQAPDYAAALLRIVEEEQVDVYVPVCSPVASRYDAEATVLLAGHCEVVHLDPDTLARVDDKDEFARLAASLGLDVPDTHRITEARQVAEFDFAARDATYILKSIAYDPVRRLDLTPLPRPTPRETAAFAASLPISESNPWILQEFVRGQEYCTHSTVRDGRQTVYGCCTSSAFQLNYGHVDQPEIEKWVETFVGTLGTGQVSLDLIQTDDGRIVGIECNPRTHSAITMFHDHPGVAAAYLEDDAPPIEPLPGSRPTYWLYHELWRMLSDPRTIPERMRAVVRGQDAIFDWEDPLPFLLVHHLQIPWLLLGNMVRLQDWVKIDFNIGKLVEPAGD